MFYLRQSQVSTAVDIAVNTGRYVVQPALSSPVAAFDIPARFGRRLIENINMGATHC